MHCPHCFTHILLVYTRTHICPVQQPPALVLLQARTDELRIQKRFLNDMFARVKQEYLERRLRQQQIEQMLGHKGNLAALPSTSAQEAGPSNALALCPAASSPLADQPDASPGQGSFCMCLSSLGGCYAFCRHWEIPIRSVSSGRFVCGLSLVGDS